MIGHPKFQSCIYAESSTFLLLITSYFIQFGPSSNATEERQKHVTTQESNTKIVIICFRFAISLLVGKLCVQLDGNAKQQKGVDKW